MIDITPEEVLAAAREVLDGTGPEGLIAAPKAGSV
jgi:hypothetical protein